MAGDPRRDRSIWIRSASAAWLESWILPAAPEPEIDFSLLSNPDKKKVLKSLEDLDFSKSELSGGNTAKLPDGDLDFTGLSSPSSFKAGDENIYNMDELPSLGGSKGVSDDPFATLLNQPSKSKGGGGPKIGAADVAEVEDLLASVGGGGLSAPPPAAPAPSAELALVFYQGNKAAHRWPLKQGENSIGVRDDTIKVFPDIDLAEYDFVGVVAAAHARIVRDGGRYWIYDLKTSAGTQVNGKGFAEGRSDPDQPWRRDKAGG